MFHSLIRGLAIAGTIASSSAGAATVEIDVTDAKGMPAANAVISLSPAAGDAPAPRTPEKSVIDQRHETFLPLVVVVRKGGEVVFTNNDATTHQVYSFSPIKQFQFEIRRGEISRPVQFGKPGIAAIGCNIHDNMVAFVYVADAPFAVIADAHGHAEISDVPEGNYRASLWHPRLRIGRQPPPVTLVVSGQSIRLSMSAEISDAMPGMSRMHKTDY